MPRPVDARAVRAGQEPQRRRAPWSPPQVINAAERRGNTVEGSDPDCKGLYLAARPNGTASWIYRYRSPTRRNANGHGKPAYLRLGEHAPEREYDTRPPSAIAIGDRLTREEAQVLAKWCRAQVVAERDPADMHRETQAVLGQDATEAAEGPSVGTLLPQWYGEYARDVAPSTARQNAGYLGLRFDKGRWVAADPPRGLYAAWRNKTPGKLTERDAYTLYGAIRNRIVNGQAVKGISANRTHALVKLFGPWLRKTGHCAADPFAHVEAPLKKEKPRDRTLDDAELLAFWRACEALGYPWGRVGQLTLLTACRPGTGNEPGEVLGAPWSEFALADRKWVIPRERVKRSEPVTVWLSDLTMGVLETLPRNGPYLFQMPGASAPFAKQSDVLDKLNAETGRQLEHQGVSASLDRFTWHDLRRTAFTLLLRFGYSKDLAHAVTNHAEADKMAVVYGSAHRYEREKRMALWALGRYVQLILELDAYAAVWGSLRQHNDIEARDAAEDAFWLALRTGGTAWGDWLAAASGASSR